LRGTPLPASRSWRRVFVERSGDVAERRHAGRAQFLDTRCEGACHLISASRSERGARLQGSLCHAYRRKWRTERNHCPITAVAAGGGWTDLTTMLRCYDIPDEAAVLEATSNPRRRWDNGAPIDGEAHAVVGVT